MKQGTLVTPLIILQLVGLAVFLKGFFPQKVVLEGYSTFDDSGSSPFAHEERAQFDKVIFIVIDALRADFLYDANLSLMHYLHSLVRKGEALPFTAYSSPPTVTLPRLKGITTGGTPSFIDAVLNIADDKDQSQGLTHLDSWVRQFKYSGSGKKLHFFGDDTWLKLFPLEVFFEKSDGTNSFFVSDFTEVDHNVTRHLQEEIESTSWDGLFLHYLGLDHIGHKGGPRSIFMKPKQVEMDSVLEMLYESRVAVTESTLLVLMGDHGMNDLGNHGGSTAGETSPGLILASPKFSKFNKGLECPVETVEDFQFYSSISQIDLVPSLSALLNFPVPKNNLGVVIPEILKLWPTNAAKNKILFENCKQFFSLIQNEYSTDDQTFQRLSRDFNELKSLDQEGQEKYFKFLKEVQQSLTSSAANYSYSLIYTGVTMIAVATVIACISTCASMYATKGLDSNFQVLFVVFCAIYALHFHGSSLIEEEHQIWWFLSILVFLTCASLLKYKNFKECFLSLVCLRVIRSWANSGQKYVTERTISAFLLNHSDILWLAMILTYAATTYVIFTKGDYILCFKLPGIEVRRYKSDDFASLVSFIYLSVISSLSFLFKLAQFKIDGHEIPTWLNFLWSFICESFGCDSHADKSILQEMNLQISKLFFLCIGSMILGRVILSILRKQSQNLGKDVLNMAVLLIIHQTRHENIPIFLVFLCLKKVLKEIIILPRQLSWQSRSIMITTTLLCLQNLAFFSIGNTNLLATLDLSNAYNGVAQYDIALVGALAFVSNFGVAIYWSLWSLDIILDTCDSNDASALKAVSAVCFQNTVFYSLSALSLVASCINLRFHLFIWSVFSPKLLYFASWSILMNSFIGGLLAILLTISSR